MPAILSTTTTYPLLPDGVTYLETVRTDYDDGSYQEAARVIGTADKLAEYKADKIRQEAASLAVDTWRVSRVKKILNEISAASDAILATAGVSPISLVEASVKPELLLDGWTIDDGTGPAPIVFSVNGQGVCKYSINGGASKNIIVFGNVLRLNNYSGSINLDLFLDENGRRYYSLPDRAVMLKKP